MNKLSEEEITEKTNLRYAWYVVAVLMLAYVSSFIDRQILSLLVRPIKRDFQITDTQMSLLMGLSFAIFYTILGIPIGRLADRKSRKGIITVGVLLWSLMTAYCGMARSYLHLFLGRIGVGVGEAALTPPAYSLISDYFPKERLAFALSVYSMGIYIGSGLALIIAGLAIQLASVQEIWVLPLVGEIYPWQMVFFFIGLPGILIALLIGLTIKEPLRKNKVQRLNASGQMVDSQVSLGEVMQYIWANRKSFLGISLGIAFISWTGYGAAAWVPSFLQRTYGWTEVQAGLAYGGVVTVFATAGSVTGGLVADRWSRRHRDGRVRALIFSSLALMITGGFYTLMPNGTLALILLIPGSFFTAFPVGTAAAAIQEIMPNQMRALASAIYFFILNMIALGTGPTAVALFTDFLFQDTSMLRYSLLLVGIIGTLLAFLSLYFTRNAYEESLDYLQNYLEGRN